LYLIHDCLDTGDAACDVGYSKAAPKKHGNGKAMGRGRRARRFVVALVDDPRIFSLESDILVRFLSTPCQLKSGQLLFHTRSQPGSVPVEWAMCIAQGTANSNAK